MKSSTLGLSNFFFKKMAMGNGKKNKKRSQNQNPERGTGLDWDENCFAYVFIRGNEVTPSSSYNSLMTCPLCIMYSAADVGFAERLGVIYSLNRTLIL